MWRALITAGAVIALTAPAFAAETTTTIEKRTITRDVVTDVPESGSTVSTTTIIAPIKPPPPRVETVAPPPYPAAVWEPGHWRWMPGRQDYDWVTGTYLQAPREHAAWVPGHWRQDPRGWVWVEGRWD